MKELDKDTHFLDSSGNDKSGKEYFERKAKQSLGVENITSNDIFEEQKRVVSKIDVNNELYKDIVNILKGLF